MSEEETVLTDCIDLWMRGHDPMPVLRRHPRVADEVLELLRIAQRVHESIPRMAAPHRATATRMILRRLGL